MEQAMKMVEAQAGVREMTAEGMISMVKEVNMGLTGIATGEHGDKAQEPVVDPKKAIRKKTITCVECGKTFKTITKRHLESHGLTPAEYKAKWGYPKSQPLSCRDTAKARSERMKNMELWKKTKPQKAPAKKPETK
jgi:predicted transcriptional regulator